MSILLKYRLPLMSPPDSGTGAAGGGGSAPGVGGTPGGSTPSTPSSTPSTPSSTPSTPSTPSGAPSAPSDTEVDFESIFSGTEPSPEPPAGTEGAAAQPQPQQTEVVPQPQQVQPAPQPTPQVPGAQPAQAPQGQQPPSTPAPAQPAGAGLDAADPRSILQSLQENEAAMVEHFAKNTFQLTKEDMEGLESDIVGTVPKLFAKAFMQTQKSMMTHLQRMIPQMMGRQIDAVRQNAQKEAKFFQRWPQLKQSEHGDLVRRLAVTYRQMNPAATFDSMVEELGPIALMAARLPLQPAGQGAAPSPMAPAPTNGVRPPQPSPFVPAVGGPGNPSGGNELNEWEAIFQHQE